jgi:hypothetical protein
VAGLIGFVGFDGSHAGDCLFELVVSLSATIWDAG